MNKTISEAVKKFVIEKLSYNQGHDGWNDGEYNVDREVENINDFAKQQFKAAEAQAQALEWVEKEVEKKKALCDDFYGDTLKQNIHNEALAKVSQLLKQRKIE